MHAAGVYQHHGAPAMEHHDAYAERLARKVTAKL
jgi:hypothetical protein